MWLRIRKYDKRVFRSLSCFLIELEREKESEDVAGKVRKREVAELYSE